MNATTQLDVETQATPQGLDSAEVARRLVQYGPNEPAAHKQRSPWLDLLILLSNPLSIILLIAAVISALVGEKIDAYLIAAMVLIGTGIDFFQTYRSRIVIDRLRSTVASTATVLRDGAWAEVPRPQIVPGDVIRLGAGDQVPADARLCESSNLYVQEANLTGESLPVTKGQNPDSASAAANSLVFLGTSVISGTATALVTETGSRTSFGDIATRLATKPPETAFDTGLRRFGYFITKIVFVLVLFVLTMNVGLHHGPLQSLLFAVALAVGLTPEFLPMITSVTLSKGAMAMARNHVVVKHLSAIQNLGSIDVLCSDKTGTLTSGIMTLEASLGPDGGAAPRALELGSLNSEYQTGLKSPLDVAILEAKPPIDDHLKCGEIPFDFERRRLSVVVEDGGQRTLICKGSPESIFPLLTSIESAGKAEPLQQEALANLQSMYAAQSREGMRVLAVAYRTVSACATYTPADEAGLTFVGFLAFADPILSDTPETLAMLQRDGIAIKILSGDSDLVTAHICSRAGLTASDVVLGTDIDRMTPPALAYAAENFTIFARLSPAQKLRVINALRSRGHVVGFIGDGVNDAPSLHAADVGIAAPRAVDIARDSADVVLLQPGLRVLHQGILEGRRAFGNVMKYLFMGTSSNFGNVLSMAAASLVLPFLPMLPTQVLLNNFLYDLSQLTIPTDNVDPEYTRNPQHWNIATIRRFMLLIGPVSSLFDFLTFYVLLHFFHASETGFHTGWFVESLATQTLVLLVIRTRRSPLRSRPSPRLLATVLFIVAVALWLPGSPFARDLGFVTLPGSYFLFLAGTTVAYLGLVQMLKGFIFAEKQPAGSTAVGAASLST